MKRAKKKAIKRGIYNWREIRNRESNCPKANETWAEGYFMGLWTIASSYKEAGYLISLLTRKEYEYIMKYPLWM